MVQDLFGILVDNGTRNGHVMKNSIAFIIEPSKLSLIRTQLVYIREGKSLMNRRITRPS